MSPSRGIDLGPLDLQVNGYAGVDFNVDDVSVDQIHGMCQRLSSDGIAGILATVITAPVDAMAHRIGTIVRAMDTDAATARMIRGIHLEGPFISGVQGFVGAHPAADVRPATVDMAQRLLDAGDGKVRLWTLAPEMDAGGRVTRMLADAGVVVAAGHTDASLEQLRGGIDAGLRLFTHLGNGCPPIMPRHDNVIQRVLHLADQVHISLVADGHHLPLFVLANFLRWIPDPHIIIVSDAIAAAGMGPGTYQLAGKRVEVDQDLATWAEGRTQFAGCATPLPKMRDILVERLGVAAEQFDRWTSANPRRLLSATERRNAPPLCDQRPLGP